MAAMLGKAWRLLGWQPFWVSPRGSWDGSHLGLGLEAEEGATVAWGIMGRRPCWVSPRTAAILSPRGSWEVPNPLSTPILGVPSPHHPHLVGVVTRWGTAP